MTDLHSEEINEYGVDSGNGNLLGIQPYLVPADYATEESFFARLDGCMQAASRRHWLNERTIAVFPEYLGTWLVAAGESPKVFRAATMTAAMTALVLHHPLAFARHYLSAREPDRIKASLFRLKAREMGHAYQAVFSRLAAQYRVTIVAGSILLPAPKVVEGKVVVGKGPLQNVSAVFRPDGSAYPALAGKIFPIADELPFVAPAPLAGLPVFDTPAGRLGVLVCADAWYPAPFERLKAAGVELVAVPIFGISTIWDAPWQGYNPGPAPVDVDPADIGTITEGQANYKYALAGRLCQSGARFGIAVCARGAVWDLGGNDCPGILVDGEKVHETGRGDQATLSNLWLN